MRSVKGAFISQRITAGMKAALVRFAHKNHTTEAEIIRQALVKHLKELGATDEELHRLSLEVVDEMEKLLKMADEDTTPLHPTAKPKASKPRKRHGT